MAEEQSSETQSRQEWGVIPGPVHRLLVRLTEKAQEIADGQVVSEWPAADVPTDFSDFFTKTLEATQGLHATATDLRSLVSAWAHKYHVPKPNFSELARAQGSTPQGLYKRYKPQTQEAIDQLLSEAPRIDLILRGFPSLEPRDLRGLSEPIDQALDAMRPRQRAVFFPRPEDGDPIADIAIAIVAVEKLNGHEPDDAEIRRLLAEDGLKPNPENVAKVRLSIGQIRARP